MTPPRFARFAAVDWSGAVGTRQPGIAVAICEDDDAPPALVRPGHIWSRIEVLEWTLEQAEAGDVLIGFDLSPSFPFVDRGAYFPEWKETPPDARALWALVEEIATDEPHLAASRFVTHAQASRYFRHHRRLGDRFGTGRGRLRVVEQATLTQHIANPYSNFNLVGAAQVGKSSLTGMRMFHRLNGRVPIWPFDARGPACVVEIYTSLAAVAAGIPKGRAKIRDGATLDVALERMGSGPHAPLARYDDHATDALLSAAWLRRIASDPIQWTPRGLTPHIARTEGWTFGVA